MSSAEQTLQSEQNLVKAIRLLAFVFSIGLAGILIAIQYTGIRGHLINPALIYFLAGGFTLIGVLFQFWHPMTTKKLAFYFIIFSVLGALFSAFVIGYDFAIIYPPWIILFFAAYIFFDKKAFLVYVAFISGAIAWLISNYSNLSREDFISVVISSLFMMLLFSLIVTVWKIADRRADRLEDAKKSEEVGRKRLIALIDSMQDAVIATNATGIIQIYNSSTLRLFDINHKLNEHSINDVIQITDVNKQPVDIMKLVDKTNENKIYSNLFYNYRDGDSITLSINVAPIKLSFFDEGTGGYAFIISDITKVKSLDDQKQEFISVASHELRTPLATAEGNLSMALMPEFGPIADKAKISVEKAYENIRQLSQIVADLSAVGESEGNLSRLEINLIDPIQISRDLEKKYKELAINKGLVFSTEISQNIKSVMTSKFRVVEILEAFLNNAVKYTEKGGIILRVETVENGVRFSVQDTGIGISKTDQPKIYNQFYQSEDFQTHHVGGTGLGLYIAKKLADRLGAKISLESHINQGTTFYLDLFNYS